MSAIIDVKWIRITTDIFDNRKIKQIETMPDGDTILVIWFKILTLAGETNDNGTIYLTREIPFNEETLSVQFNRPINTIRLALETFTNLGMIEIVDDFIHVTNWEKYQNQDALKKLREQNNKRQREFRERRKMGLLEDSNVTVTLHNATEKRREEKKRGEYDVSKDTSSDLTAGRGLFPWLVDAWNELKPFGIAPIRKITEHGNRAKLIRARLGEYSQDDFMQAIENIKNSKFLQGKEGKGRWVITFDWFIAPSNFPKVLEGQYNNRKFTGDFDLDNIV